MTIDLWQLLSAFAGMLVVLVSAIFTAGKMLLTQFEGRLNDRFKAQDQSRLDSQKHWDERFSLLGQSMTKNNEESLRIERELMSLKADLPNSYVRRDDYIRNQTVIESKIDGLAVRIENAILKGEKHG